jgi:PPOX class probable F420-dependent enzyme
MNLGSDAARRAFAASRSAQLATADADGQPHIVPVTFAVDADRVYIAIDSKPKRSMDLKRLRNIAANPKVSLLTDEYDDDWSRLWWARADGTARILYGDDRRAPLELLQRRYSQYDVNLPQGPVIEVTVARWSGWSFSPAPERLRGAIRPGSLRGSGSGRSRWPRRW